MTALDRAESRIASVNGRASTMAVIAARHWRSIDAERILSSWAVILPQILLPMTAAQRAVAAGSSLYVKGVVQDQGLSADNVGILDPGSLTGYASGGQPLMDLFIKAPITALIQIRKGKSVRDSLAMGQAVLDSLIRTQILDAARAADLVNMVATPSVNGYTRRVRGSNNCSRCALKSAQFYRINSPFLRHPRCDCMRIPTKENLSQELRSDPKGLILSGRVSVTPTQFEAVKLGADPASVINANAGMSPAFSTGSKRVGSRPTPEELIRSTRGSRDETIRLLRARGYLKDEGITP